MSTKFNFIKISKAVDTAFKESIQVAGKDAELYFKKSFDNQGFTDESFESWKPTKGIIRSLGAKSLGSRKTLHKTGKLKRSIRRLSSLGGYGMNIISDLPYSAIHNEGLMGNAWGKHKFKMPKRKFIGNSGILERRQVAKMATKLKTAALNSFKG